MLFLPSITEPLAAAPDQEPTTPGSAGTLQKNNVQPPSRTFRTFDPAVLCPCCCGSMIRIWRRPIDRALSFFTPLHRFRCEAHDCLWEGNIRQTRMQRNSTGGRSGSRSVVRKSTIPVAFVVHMMLVFFGVVFVFVMAHVDWPSTNDELMTDAPRNYSERVGLPPAEQSASKDNDEVNGSRSNLPTRR